MFPLYRKCDSSRTEASSFCRNRVGALGADAGRTEANISFVLVPIEQGRLRHELDVHVRVESVLPHSVFCSPWNEVTRDWKLVLRNDVYGASTCPCGQVLRRDFLRNNVYGANIRSRKKVLHFPSPCFSFLFPITRRHPREKNSIALFFCKFINILPKP